MKTLFKVFLGLLVLLMILAIATPVALVLFFDPNDHKDFIVDKVQQHTGRSLRLEGNIELSYYPWLGLKVERLTFGNAAGFGEEPMFRSQLLQVRVKLLPLLRKAVEMDTIRVHGAELNLAIDAQGRGNWADLVKPTEEEAEPLPIAALAIGGVDVRDARINFTNAQAETRYEISELAVQTGELSIGDPINMSVAMKLESAKPALAGKLAVTGVIAYDQNGGRLRLAPFALQSDFTGPNVPAGAASLELSSAVDVDLDEETAAIRDLALRVLDVDVSGDLNARRIASNQPAVEANLKIAAADLAPLLKVLEIEPLASRVAKARERGLSMDLKLATDLERGDLQIPKLTAQVFGADISAQLSAARIQSDKPSVKGKLEARGPDLPLLVELGGQLQPGKQRNIAELGKSLARAPDKAFNIAADFDADLDRGNVTVPTLAAKLLGATIDGRLSAAKIRSDKPTVKGSLKAKGPDLPMLIQLFGQFQAASGERGLAEMGKNLAELPDKAFDVATDFDADLGYGKVTIPELSVHALGISIDGKLQASDVNSDNGAVSGNLAVSAPQLKPLLRAIEQKEVVKVLRGADLQAGVSGTMSRLALKPLHIDLTLAGRRIPNSPVKVALGADAEANLNKQTLDLQNLSAQGLGLDLRGSLKATQIKEAPKFAGDLKLAPFNLRAFLHQIEHEVPVTADPKVLTRVGLRSAFSGSQSDVSLKGFALTLDQTQAQGDLAVVGFADPDIQFQIGIDNLNADRYLPPAEKEPAGTAAQQPKQKARKGKKARQTAQAARERPARLPMKALRKLKLKGDLSIGQLVLSGAKMSDIRLSINARNGKLNLNPTEFKLYKGSYKGKLALDASGKQARVQLDTALNGVQAEPLLVDLTGESRVSGIANFQASLHAVGANSNQLKRTLTGQGRFAIDEGIYRGIDIGQTLANLEIMLESKRAQKVKEGKQTRFDQISGTFQVKNGVVTNDDLVLTGEGFRVTGKGVLGNLTTERIKYDLLAKAVERSATRNQSRYNLGGYSIPIACDGNFEDPSCDPDYGSILVKAGIKAATGIVGKTLEGAGALPEGVGETLKKVLDF